MLVTTNLELFEFKEKSKKPIVVFFHGFNSTHKFIQPILKRERSFSIYSFDFPGNGNTPIAGKASIKNYGNIARQYLDQFEEPVTVVAHSLGGAVINYISDHPNIKDIILIAPVNPYMISDAPENKDIKTAKDRRDDAINRFKSFINNEDRKDYLKHVAKATVNYIAESKRRNEFIKDMLDNEVLNHKYLTNVLYEKYKNNRKPTFLIQGIRDVFVPVESSAKISKEMNWKMYPLEDTGHSPISERPKDTLKIIEAIINR